MNYSDESNHTRLGDVKISEAIKNNLSKDIPHHWIKAWLLHILQQPTSFLITDQNYQLADRESKQFNAGIAKMQQGTPLAYLTGQQEFWSLDFKVNEHTLIPRPDTEVLVEQVLDWINGNEYFKNNSPKRLLDLGTGSGCIAISMAHELKAKNRASAWQIVAVDISEEALQVARHNAKSNNTKVEFIQSSWYDKLSTDSDKCFDIIVSNPPYIDEADSHLQGLQAEPLSALTAANNGLADIEHIVQQSPNYLRNGGLLAIEHGYDQGAAVKDIFLANGFESVATRQDYGGNDRVTLGQLS